MALPGVHGVLIGADMMEITNPLIGMMSLAGLHDAWHWALATDRARLVGDPVAIVVPDSGHWRRTLAI